MVHRDGPPRGGPFAACDEYREDVRGGLPDALVGVLVRRSLNYLGDPRIRLLAEAQDQHDDQGAITWLPGLMDVLGQRPDGRLAEVHHRPGRR